MSVFRSDNVLSGTSVLFTFSYDLNLFHLINLVCTLLQNRHTCLIHCSRNYEYAYYYYCHHYHHQHNCYCDNYQLLICQ
jgi:hypothetical protein